MSNSTERQHTRTTVILAEPAGGGSTDPADDIYPAGRDNAHPSRLALESETRLAGELEGGHLEQGLHPGDKYVRRARPDEEGFRRLGPGHLEALPQTLRRAPRLGRSFGGSSA